MGNLEIGWLAAGGLAIAVVVVAVLVYRRFRGDMRTAQERLLSGGSQVIETDCGPIEYAISGEGPPVLVVHGIFGGFDQGLVIARGNVGEDFRSIAPSRFGYLRTPLSHNATPAGQADAFACLLDALGIGQAAILGTSAGGTSAIQFALRHPDRCWALVLFCSAAPGEAEAALFPRPLAAAMFKSDFLFWLLTTYLRSSLKSIMGVPKGFELTPEYEADVAGVMRTILPVSPRAEGAVFDMFVSNPDVNIPEPAGYPLEEIRVPVLVVNAVDDPLTLYANAKAAAERIPSAKLVTIEDGGTCSSGTRRGSGRKWLPSWLEYSMNSEASRKQVKQVFSTRTGRDEDNRRGQFRYCPFCGAELSPEEKGGQQRPACPKCGFVQYRNPLPGVVVLIEHEGAVLLGRRRGGFGTGRWGLPQGYIEFDEDFLTAAIREVKEETGLDVEILSILNVVSNLLSPRLNSLAIVLLAGVVGGNPGAGDDLEALEWVPLSGPLPEMAFEADERIIQSYRQTELRRGLPVDPGFAS